MGAPDMLHQGSDRDVMEALGTPPLPMVYQMSTQGLAATGQIEKCYSLLERAEAIRLLSHPDGSCYPMLRTQLEVCRAVGDPEGAARAQRLLERLGVAALAVRPLA